MNESRRVKINDKRYRIVGYENGRKVEAIVYEDDGPSGSTMAEVVELKHRLRGLVPVKRSHRSLPEVMQDALTKAVEQVENKRLTEEEIDERIDNVKETYER